MIVCYDPATGEITATAEVGHVEDYKAMLDAQGTPYIEAHGYGMGIALFAMRVVNGALVEKPTMQIVAPANLKVGAEAVFTGVPAGVTIMVGDSVLGTMDDSGQLEFTAETAGTYRFVFAGAGYLAKEVCLEAVA